MSHEWEPECYARYMGAWAIEPRVGESMAELILADKLPAVAARGGVDAEPPPYVLAGGMAMVAVSGMLMKPEPKYGGTSTVRTRQALRAAVADRKAKAIVLAIDSPGGTVDGTDELAQMVRRVNAEKPVYAVVEDMAASAAYWIASRATRVYANQTAAVGSIGVYTYVRDFSEAMQREGIKTIVVSSGPQKGGGVPGAPVTDEQIAALQGEIDALNNVFVAAVAEGRPGLDQAAVRKLATGEVWIGEQARAVGLVDVIATREEALNAIAGEIAAAARDTRMRRLGLAGAGL